MPNAILLNVWGNNMSINHKLHQVLCLKCSILIQMNGYHGKNFLILAKPWLASSFPWQRSFPKLIFWRLIENSLGGDYTYQIWCWLLNYFGSYSIKTVLNKIVVTTATACLTNTKTSVIKPKPQHQDVHQVWFKLFQKCWSNSLDCTF